MPTTVNTVYGTTNSVKAEDPNQVHVTAKGRDSANDGGGGMFFWDGNEGALEDYGTIFTRNTSQNGGRWKRVLYNKVYDVKWFGAKGDASTDDRLAIQRALDAAASNVNEPDRGGIVLFPPGIYRVTQKLNITSSRVHLLGDGNATIKVDAGAAITTGLVEAIGPSATTPYEDITIENLTFEGNSDTSKSARSAVFFEKIRTARIIGCKVKGAFVVVDPGPTNPKRGRAFICIGVLRDVLLRSIISSFQWMLPFSRPMTQSLVSIV